MIRLSHNALELLVSPDQGGCVQALNWHGQSLLRPGPTQSSPDWDARHMAAFAMVPFPGRIHQGRFSATGGHVQLPANMPPEPHAIHGFGWQQAWTPVDTNQTSVCLAHKPTDPAWPWDYVAYQTFTLEPDALLVQLSLTNRSGTSMPAGLGWHPYFPRAGATLQANTTSVWPASPGEDGPEPGDIPPHQLLSGGRDVDSLSLDHAFDVTDDPVRLHWPEVQLELHSDPVFSKLVVYVPENEDFFCVEPLTQVPDAVNAQLPETRTGLKWLAPGATLSGRIHLRVTANR